jgi:hypothetical protein
MLLDLVRLIVLIAECYALAGLLFALVFLPRGIVRVDERLHESPKTVRLLLFPGVAAFWPLFAWRWIAGRGAPIERNPHRIAAQARTMAESRTAAETSRAAEARS